MDPTVGERARGVLSANRALRAVLTEGAASLAILDLLLFLAAEDMGDGVTTSQCCNAVEAPRTTVLRWIGTLVSLDLVGQAEDEADRRITRLRLTARAQDAIDAWMRRIGGR